MNGIAFNSQQQALKSQRGVKPTDKLSAMEKVPCTVYCAFKHSCSHGPVTKPKPTHDVLPGVGHRRHVDCGLDVNADLVLGALPLGVSDLCKRKYQV